MLPVPGPGTEDSVTSDSDLQQSLSRCWALLPAVSSLTVMPKLTCPTTDTGLGGIHFKLSPRFPGRSLAAALPIRVRARGGRGPATIQHQVQSCECKLLFRLEAASGPRCQWFQVCKLALLTVTPSSRGTRSRQCCFEKFLPLIEVWFHVSISHWVSLFHIFTLNPVGIPAVCSVGIPVVSWL